MNEHINVTELTQFLYDNITFEMFFEFCVIYFFIVWIALIIWVIKDISNRTNNILMHIFSLFLIIAFTPIFGFFLYLIVRPSQTLFEQHYEVIENNFDILSDVLADYQIKKIESQHVNADKLNTLNTSSDEDLHEKEISVVKKQRKNVKIETVLQQDTSDILNTPPIE